MRHLFCYLHNYGMVSPLLLTFLRIAESPQLLYHNLTRGGLHLILSGVTVACDIHGSRITEPKEPHRENPMQLTRLLLCVLQFTTSACIMACHMQ